MSERARGVLVGLGVGLATLLLLDLARILAGSVNTGETSVWWPIACFAGVGIIVGVGVSAGRRDRLIPASAALLVAALTLPGILRDGPGWIPDLPLVPATSAGLAVATAAVGALAYGALASGRG